MPAEERTGENSLFQSAEGIKIKEIDLKDLDVTTFSGYLPWNIRYGTNKSIMEMQRFMEERNG